MAYHAVGAGRGEIASLLILASKFMETNLAVSAPSATCNGSVEMTAGSGALRLRDGGKYD